MCWRCDTPLTLTPAVSAPFPLHPPGVARRQWLQKALVLTCWPVALPAWSQVDVGGPSRLRQLVPAGQLEAAAQQQYDSLLRSADQAGQLAPSHDPQLLRLRRMAQRMLPFTAAWNPAARQWRWEVHLIEQPLINAFCMPGGKIAFYRGLLEQLRLSDDEAAMVMGHEMAHALREHARAQLAKTQATRLGLSLGAQLLGWGDLGQTAANLGTRLISLRFSRSDESEADLVGLELAARAGFAPGSSVSLWRKMNAANQRTALPFLSTHPSGPSRIRELERHIPQVMGLYEQARR